MSKLKESTPDNGKDSKGDLDQEVISMTFFGTLGNNGCSEELGFLGNDMTLL